MDMAGFERSQGAVTGAVREWRWGKFAPLYAAGILVGISAGFAIATWPWEAPEVQEHAAITQPAPNVDLAFDVPVISLPEGGVLQANPAVTTDLPLETRPDPVSSV